jgi:arylsulfatase A-like enzyme
MFDNKRMRKRNRLSLLFLCLILLAAMLAIPIEPAKGGERKPNIIFLLADDLGYGDIGCFGQAKIRTPNLDRMASEGVRLTQHYSGNAVCAPSRCVLMTGLHPGHAFIRNNKSVPPEGQYPLPADTVTLAKLLKQVGYVTGGFGKWGLGPPAGHSTPGRQGFDRFYGYHCQSKAHNYYPAYLWSDDAKVLLHNGDFSAHQILPTAAAPNDPQSYARYVGRDYAPDLITNHALEFIRANRDRPFFLYYPTTVPHLALQVPEDSLAEYRDQFADTPYVGDRRYLPHPRPRAAYAAMITRMDREIGRMMDLIKELGLDEDTIFVFSSDNGPLYDQLGGTDSDYFHSAASLRGRKGSLYEGGIRVPTIFRWKHNVEAGATESRVSGFEDWLPTLMEFAGAAQLVPEGLDGISMASTLLGKAQPPRAFLYREFPAYGGQQSLRMGNWKAVRQNLIPKDQRSEPELRIELYDLADDPGESRDVANENREIAKKMADIMHREHRPSAEFPFPALDQN